MTRSVSSIQPRTTRPRVRRSLPAPVGSAPRTSRSPRFDVKVRLRDDVESAFRRFPSTRYQGSKRKLALTIVRELADLPFQTVLDAFGGTGSVAYAFKLLGKSVTYNDSLEFNRQVGVALIENRGTSFAVAQAEALGERRRDVTYPDFIQRTFAGIYFTDEENAWLDIAVGNVRRISDRLQRALAWFAVFQAAMAKRPYNLFHRRNLYMRLAEVDRGFGNKRTWDRPFPELVRRFAEEANRAVLDTGVACRAVRSDARELQTDFDLVYLDPPYINARGVGVCYRDFYHFLEGLVRYDDWPELVSARSRHRAMTHEPDPWSDPALVREAFLSLVQRFHRSIVAVSYRSDGVPSVEELATMLRTVKRRVRVVELGAYRYVLSDNHRSREVLLIGSG